MKIFIEIPAWLGDAIMTTPAIENITSTYPDAKITLFGSFVSTEALKKHPQVERVIIDESKKATIRALWIYKTAKSLGKFDMSFTFRQRLYPKLLQLFLNSKRKFIYKRYTKELRHQALRYNDFVNYSLKTNYDAKELKLYYTPKKYPKKTLGLNPGATYGSAKRWYPDRFALVAKELSSEYDIVIFGGNNEVEMANEIETILKQNRVTNYQNLAGKTSVGELIEHIAGLSLFITNDSGPMHIASAYKVPTIALFGPTKYKETSPWKNKNAKIIRYELECSPCMKRSCPLKTHECMKKISVEDVLRQVK
jgi:heptosyltransferase-2